MRDIKILNLGIKLLRTLGWSDSLTNWSFLSLSHLEDINIQNNFLWGAKNTISALIRTLPPH